MGVIMEMFSALWQVGVFAAVILFGTKLGIASGLAKISKRNLTILALGYGGGIMLLSAIASLYTSQITYFINRYGLICLILTCLFRICNAVEGGKRRTTEYTSTLPSY